MHGGVGDFCSIHILYQIPWDLCRSESLEWIPTRVWELPMKKTFLWYKPRNIELLLVNCLMAWFPMPTLSLTESLQSCLTKTSTQACFLNIHCCWAACCQDIEYEISVTWIQVLYILLCIMKLKSELFKKKFCHVWLIEKIISWHILQICHQLWSCSRVQLVTLIAF